LGATTLDEFQLDAAEVYEDGVIDVNDLTALIQMVLTGQG
jgi:hypothetical protein